LPRAAAARCRDTGRGAARALDTEIELARTRRGTADVAVFHDFVAPPSGGGSQFLRALVGELRRQGVDVEINRISGETPVCLFNSFNFDFHRLRRFARTDCRLVHRVDGPIGSYRGFDDGTDGRILEINSELADATILQSRYSLERHRELGLELRDPVVIPNAVDPALFHPPQWNEPLADRKVRLIATSWSDNPKKGADTLAWLDRNLDWSRYEMTFAGRPPIALARIHTVGPLPSPALGDLLRSHDVYVAPSLDDPCSNALLEALACGLPAVFAASGGHPELVGQAGLPFTAPDEIPAVLDLLRAELDQRRAAIAIPSVADVAARYLAVLRS
jgi:glycosyltransferase involved in cell wall biosynthesis